MKHCFSFPIPDLICQHGAMQSCANNIAAADLSRPNVAAGDKCPVTSQRLSAAKVPLQDTADWHLTLQNWHAKENIRWIGLPICCKLTGQLYFPDCSIFLLVLATSDQGGSHKWSRKLWNKAVDGGRTNVYEQKLISWCFSGKQRLIPLNAQK